MSNLSDMDKLYCDRNPIRIVEKKKCKSNVTIHDEIQPRNSSPNSERTSAHSIKFETQWDYNTQLEHVIDNADALVSLINTNENEDILDNTETVIFSSQGSGDSVSSILTPSNNNNRKVGFNTASKKPIKISQENLKKAEKLFMNIDTQVCNDLKNFSQWIPNSPDPDSTIIDIKENLGSSGGIGNLNENETPNISDDIFKTIDFENSNDDSCPSSPIILTRTSLRSSKISTQKCNTLTKKRKKCGDNSGNKKVKLSPDIKDTLHNLNSNTVESIDVIFDDDFEATEKESKSIELSLGAFAMAKTKSVESTYTGFMTASNKRVDVSESALQKSKLMFDNMEEEKSQKISGTHDSCSSFGFMTASNKKIDISEEAMIKAQLLFVEDGEKSDTFKKPESPNRNKQSFRGFMTASNKRIEISKDALDKVKNIFEDIDKNENIPKTHSKFSGFTTGNNKEINISQEALNKTKHLFDDVDAVNDYSTTVFDGFKTASNKKIDVSEDALNRTKHLFDNLEEEKVTTGKIIDQPGFSGFKTANNKKVDVSEDALKKVKHLFDDEEIPNSKPKFSGFTTASNKKVDISEDALKKVKHLFDDDEIPNSQPKFSGFTTASNKKVEVSEDALKKVKHLFDDDDEVLKSRPKFGGFTTASNKKVEVSEDALKKVKHLFDDDEIPNSQPKFSGFTTASNRKVEISEDALKKVKHLFDDDEFQNSQPKIDGFTTANIKQITVSEDALRKVKNIFDDCDNQPKKIKLDEFSEDILSDVKDLYDEFENDMFAQTVKKEEEANEDIVLRKSLEEEFSRNFNEVPSLKSLSIKTVMNHNDEERTNESQSLTMIRTEISESPSSPVIRIKNSIRNKRKSKIAFRTPYKKDYDEMLSDNPSNKIKISGLDKDARKNVHLGDLLIEKMTKNRKSLASLKRLNSCSSIDKDILDLTPQNHANYIFKEGRIDVKSESEHLSVNNLIQIFNNHKDVNEKLIPEGWIQNHIKWIMWKLASYERTCEDFSMTVSNVLKQLKYRYDRELYRTERPILRKVLEKDEVPGKRMILCVSNIILLESIKADSDKNKSLDNVKYDLELTDGWYDIRTVIDPILSSMIDKGRIKLGTKLIMYGAELLNCQEGVAPLEDRGSVRLKIWANNCRRAASWSKLGLYKNPNKPIPLKIETYKVGGGPISSLRLVPINIYPIMYLNKLSDGSVAMRSERVQQVYNVKMEADLQKGIEQIYLQVEKEFGESENKKNNAKQIRKTILDSDSPEKLIAVYENVADPGEFLNSLNPEQRDIIQRYDLEKNARIRREIDDRVRELVNEQGLAKQQAVKVLKSRVLQYNNDICTSAILTVWKSNDEIIDMFKENKCLVVTNLTLTSIRFGEMHLSAGKRSTFFETSVDMSSHINKYTNCCYKFSNIYENTFSPKFNEVNVVGIVIDVIPKLEVSEQQQNRMQTVYIADEFEYLIAVNFWGGVNKYGFGKIIENNVCLAFSNLQHRSRSITKRLRQFYVTELSNIARRPKQKYLQNALDDLENKTKGQSTYLQRCREKLTGVLNVFRENAKKLSIRDKIENDEHCSSILDLNSKLARDSSSSSNSSDSRINISSMIANSSSTSFNESTVERRINKLKMYGEPPPLPPVILTSSKRLNRNFVSPCSKSSNKDQISKVDPEKSSSPPLSLK